jgi:hypothetical protein
MVVPKTDIGSTTIQTSPEKTANENHQQLIASILACQKIYKVSKKKKREGKMKHCDFNILKCAHCK